MPHRLGCTIRNKLTEAIVTTPSKWSDLRWLDQLDDLGGFNLTLLPSDPGYTLARKGMVVRFTIDGHARWDGVIRRRRHRKIANTGGRSIDLIGFGEIVRLEDMVVDPSGGLGRFPFSDSRPFDWTAPEFDDSTWSPLVVTPANYGTTTENYGLPEGFPDGTAEWVWPIDSSGSVPARTVEMRGHGTIPSQRVYEAWSASDDTNEGWIQGISMLKSAATAYVGRTQAIEVLMSAGPVTVAARVVNLNALKAGYLFSLLVPLDGTVSPAVNSGADWVYRPTGAPLGMNAGQIMNILFDEADARGEDTPARTWTDTHDSDSNLWTIYEELTVQVGTTYLDVLKQMVDLQMCEFRKAPGEWKLHLYNADGAGSTAGIALTESNLKDLTFDDVDEPPTAMLIRWANGYTDTEDAALIAAQGRRRGFLALGGVPSSTAAEGQADTLITSLNGDRRQVTATYRPASPAEEPYGDNGIRMGDVVDVFDEDGDGTAPQRCVGIAVQAGAQTGEPQFELTLNSKILEADKRAQVVLRRSGLGNLGGSVRASTVPYQPRPVTPREPQTVDWSERGPVIPMIGAAKTFERAIRVRELRVELLTASSSGTVDVDLLKNGVVVASVSVPVGRLQKYTPVTNVVFSQRPTDVMTVEITSAGTGANTPTITVTYA